MKSINDKESAEFKERSALGRALMLGSNFIAGFLVCGGVGYWADGKWGEDKHTYTLIGVFLGLLWSFYEVYKVTVQSAKAYEASETSTQDHETPENKP